jgi:MFS family permease
MSAVATDVSLIPASTKRRTLALLSLGHGAAHWYTGLYSVILPVVAEAFGLSYTQVGLIGAARGAGSSLSSALGGVLADITHQRKAMLLLCLISTAAAYALLGTMPTFAGALIFLTLGVLGNSTWHPLAMPVLTYLFPRRMGLTLGLHDSGAQIVQAISPLIIGVLLTRIDWRSVLQLNWLPGLIMAILLGMALPHIPIAQREGQGRFRERFKTDVLGNGRMWLVSGVWTLTGVAREGLLTFLPLFVAFELGLSSVWVGIAAGCVTLVGALAAPLVGWMADKVGQQMILLGTMLGGTVFLISLPHVGSELLLVIVAVMLGLLVFSTRSIFFASAMGVTATDVGGSTIGLMFFLNRGFAAVSPLLAGGLAERFGLAHVFYFFGLTNVLAAVLIRTLPKRDETRA